ncbi:MAG: endonuclease/exonuclease/phosphatase family protein [Pirellulales bacterium]
MNTARSSPSLALRVGVIGLGLLLAVHAAERPGLAVDASSPPRANLKVLTWNIQMLPTALAFASDKLQKGQALRAPWIVEYLNERDYDIVVLQEVIDPPIAAQLKSGLKATYPHLVAADAKLGVAGCSGGILIASRLPLKYVTHCVYKNCTGVDKLAEKGCLLVEGARDGVTFQIAGTHLQAGDDATRDKQFAEIRDSVVVPHRREGVPLLLLGDMNVDVKEREFPLLLELTGTRNFPLDDPQPFTVDGHNSWNEPTKRSKHIDHVLVDPRGTGSTLLRQTVQRARREHEGKTIDYADHYGVIAELIICK